MYSTGPLLIFLLAALLVVGGVALLALHPTLWMLLVVIAIDLASTASVLSVVAKLLED